MCANSCWAKRKLEENWPSSLSKAITKVENFSDVGGMKNSGSRRIISSFTKNQGMTVNGTMGKEAQQRINPNNSKVRGLNPRGTL